MDFPRILYIQSEEPFLVKEKLAELKTAFIEQYMEVNFKEPKTEQLEVELETYPFFAEKKMLLLDAKDNEDTAKLIADTPDFCSVIIINKLDKRKKLYKTIKKVGEICELKTYNEKEMTDWVIKIGRKMGVNVPRDAARRVVEICGLGDMHFIYNEMVKVASMKTDVTVELIDRVVQKTPEYNAFVLTDAISRKDKKGAYQIIKVLAEQNEYLPLVLSMVNRNFAVLRMVKTMRDTDIKATGVHPYTIKLLKPHASKFTVEHLDELLAICQQIDFDMKNGCDHRVSLEKIIGVIQ